MGKIEQPLVSIITPFFNAEKYLPEAVESVLNQNYDNWELLLIDDGSTDNSAAIARRYAREFSKITCLCHGNNENKGAGLSRNLGLAHAKGKYIALLDADDVWFPGKLVHQIGLMQHHPDVGMVCGATLFWKSWDDSDKQDELKAVGCEQNKIYSPPGLLSEIYPLEKGSAPCVSGLMIKSEVANQVNGFVDKSYGLYEDQLFLTKIYLCSKVYVSDKCYDKYRIRTDSVCGITDQEGSYHYYRLRYLKWLKAYLSDNGIQFQEVENSLARNLLKYESPRYFEFLKLNRRVKARMTKSFTRRNLN